MAGEAAVNATQSGEVVRESARTLEPDRYLASLLAPKTVRSDLMALAAFTAEINKIPLVVSDPHLAEIRLQWWRDAVLAPQPSATGNPVADAFAQVLAQQADDMRALTDDWFDAVAYTFYPSGPETESDLFTELELREGTPFLLAARICGAEPSSALQQITACAGRAYGLARLGVSMAHDFARGRFPLPQVSEAGLGEGAGPDSLVQSAAKGFIASRARAALEQLRAPFQHGSPAPRAAILPLALVEPYLRACERQEHDLTRAIAEIAPLVRVWRIWRAHRTGRL